MGMFDYLFIDTKMLPVSDEEKILIGNEPGWQTKDFDNILTEIYITNDGELKINRWEYDVVPKEERPHPDDDGVLGLAGSLERTNVRLETIPHHGYVNFYTFISKKWYEFNAKFTDGKLVEIKEEKMTEKIKKEDLWCEYSDLPSPMSYNKCTDYDSMGNHGRFPISKNKVVKKHRKYLEKLKKFLSL